jgi:hypothetical protein
MNMVLGVLEKLYTKALVLIIGLMAVTFANAADAPLYFAILPLENLDQVFAQGEFGNARDIVEFKEFLEKKYHQDLRIEDLPAIVQTDDLKEYQSVNRERAEMATNPRPTCAC